MDDQWNQKPDPSQPADPATGGVPANQGGQVPAQNPNQGWNPSPADPVVPDNGGVPASDPGQGVPTPAPDPEPAAPAWTPQAPSGDSGAPAQDPVIPPAGDDTGTSGV